MPKLEGISKTKHVLQEKAYTDKQLEQKINELCLAVQKWAISNGLWYDSGFKSFLEHVDTKPGTPCVVSILYFEGPLYQVFNGTYGDGKEEEFNQLLTKLGYEYELQDHVTMYIYASEPILAKAFEDYFHWKWVCSLIQPDCGDVYEELYASFAKNPEQLNKMDWRDFEIFLFRIFQNQGFQAVLGTGQNDGGVDIKLFQRDPLGDVLTLVQAKRYAPKNKIKLEAVAALNGIVHAEEAQNGLFVTTSEYLPSAKKFAGRLNVNIELRTSKDVIEWCNTASAGIINDKSKLISKQNITKLIQSLKPNGEQRVLHARTGYNITTNAFALVIKETKYAALLMALPKFTLSHDGFMQRGYEAPILDHTASSMLVAETVWRAKRSQDKWGTVNYWDGSRLYSTWDGKPQYFDFMD